MPSNYPAPPQYAKPAKIPGAFKGVITGAGHSSIYLTPVQEERIINWRQISTSSQPSRPKVKSAPASVRLPSNSSCTCTCTDCQESPSAITSCSCSFHSPKLKTPCKSKKGKGPNSHVKSYYSRNTAPESSNMTSTLPAMMTVRPKTLPVGRQPPKVKINKAWAASRSSYEQISPPITGPPQWTVPFASPMDMFPANTEIQMPRIAGSRDPISQN